jgi:hypothetical protein
MIGANDLFIAAGSEVQKAHTTEGIITARWWSLKELRATNRLVFPEDLAERIDRMNLPSRMAPV